MCVWRQCRRSARSRAKPPARTRRVSFLLGVSWTRTRLRRPCCGPARSSPLSVGGPAAPARTPREGGAAPSLTPGSRSPCSACLCGRQHPRVAAESEEGPVSFPSPRLHPAAHRSARPGLPDGRLFTALPADRGAASLVPSAPTPRREGRLQRGRRPSSGGSWSRAGG